MPWQEVSAVSLRQEFAMLARHDGANVRELCRRFGISPPTGYMWLGRFDKEGVAGLKDRSRRPHHSPRTTSASIEADVVRMRKEHPAWGGRKIRARLLMLGHKDVPSPSTITAIFRRNGLIDPAESQKHRAFKRFEHAAPNLLWQMDFKGHFPTSQGRCHPLTVLDDHSRYALGLEACADERHETVQERLVRLFRTYGMPMRMLADNGSPWGSDQLHPHTRLTVWLMRMGIRVSHCRPRHPQTQGKEERFHRTLVAELISRHSWRGLEHCQSEFSPWRHAYNHERPHEALGMATPASRYQPSPRSFPEVLPELEYAEGDLVRMVQAEGVLHFKGREFVISKAFRGCPVGLRPAADDGVWDVRFSAYPIAQIDLRAPKEPAQSVNYVSEHM